MDIYLLKSFETCFLVTAVLINPNIIWTNQYLIFLWCFIFYCPFESVASDYRPVSSVSVRSYLYQQTSHGFFCDYSYFIPIELLSVIQRKRPLVVSVYYYPVHDAQVHKHIAFKEQSNCAILVIYCNILFIYVLWRWQNFMCHVQRFNNVEVEQKRSLWFLSGIAGMYCRTTCCHVFVATRGQQTSKSPWQRSLQPLMPPGNQQESVCSVFFCCCHDRVKLVSFELKQC